MQPRLQVWGHGKGEQSEPEPSNAHPKNYTRLHLVRYTDDKTLWFCWALYQVALGHLGVTLSLHFCTEVGFLPTCPQLGSWLVVELRELGETSCQVRILN